MQQDNDIDIIMSYQHALICRCPKWDKFKTKDFYFYLAGNSGSLTWVAVLQVHAGSFRASLIHLTLAWTTGYLLCVRAHLYSCVYPRVIGHTDSESAQHTFCVCLLPCQLKQRGLDYSVSGGACVNTNIPDEPPKGQTKPTN